MKNFKQITTHFSIAIILAAGLSACTGEKPTKVNSLQARDKALSCSDILLEINESEFYRKEAEKARGLGLKTVVAPVGYIDTYMNAGDAVGAANARVEYLNRIYEIRKCDKEQSQPSQTLPSYQGQPAQGTIQLVPATVPSQYPQIPQQQIPVQYQQPQGY